VILLRCRLLSLAICRRVAEKWLRFRIRMRLQLRRVSGERHPSIPATGGAVYTDLRSPASDFRGYATSASITGDALALHYCKAQACRLCSFVSVKCIAQSGMTRRTDIQGSTESIIMTLF